MKVILTRAVKPLGSAGDVKNVKRGYARNFLFPRELAVEATQVNLRAFERAKASLVKKEETIAAEVRATAEKLAAHTVVLTKKAGDAEGPRAGRLFGAVTTAEIAIELRKAGFSVEKKHLSTEEPIRNLGVHTVKAHFGHGVEADVKVEVRTLVEPAKPSGGKKGKSAKAK